jgi:hypothetical protein
VSPARADLSALLETERDAYLALKGLGGAITAPEAQECLDELHFTTRWFCSGLAKHVRQRARRATPEPPPLAGLLSERLSAAPTGVDRIRLLTQTQRAVLLQVESVLAGSLAPDLRTFLEQARAVLTQSVTCCEAAIAALDRQREVRPDSAG